MLPFIADQGLIAQAVAAKGVGVEVARNYDDGSFHRDDVAAAIQRVMVEEEGKELARKAIEVRGILGDRVRQEMYLDELVGYLQYPALSKNPAMAATSDSVPAAAAAASSSPLHIVVFPWLAFGHMIPFLELSKRLARRGHAVTFISTPRNAARLGAIPPAMSAHLRVVPLDLPAVDGLPEGAESTADVPPEKVGLLKKAFDGLAVPFASLVAEACGTAGDGEAAAGFSRKPDWIILDFAQNWLWPIAEEHEIPCAVFFILPAAFVTFIGPKQENLAHPRRTTEDYMVAPPWVPFPSTLAYRRHEAEWIAAAFRPNASGVSDVERLMEMERSCCRLIVYRSCPEAEPRLFPLLNKLFAKPVVPAGLLLPVDIVDDNDAPNTTSDQSFVSAIQWLDMQPNGSVIYVALGSEAPITTNHVHELALGLELAGVRFLWALRPPSGINSQTGTFLPSGFESRVATRGIVCTEWVPQVRVLAHGAVGAFLTHCGWGSTVESFHFGHPLVMLPFIADQGLIAQAMAARGIGVEVSRNYDDGSFYRDDVAAAVRLVMVEEEGKVLARKAKEVHSILGDKARQEQYIDEFVGYLQHYR
uniref:Glycosyltransferase n=1 Tax=Oryza punctata TaxID=4537 RepID=A0A0E0LI94_ORYPU